VARTLRATTRLPPDPQKRRDRALPRAETVAVTTDTEQFMRTPGASSLPSLPQNPPRA